MIDIYFDEGKAVIDFKGTKVNMVNWPDGVYLTDLFNFEVVRRIEHGVFDSIVIGGTEKANKEMETKHD